MQKAPDIFSYRQYWAKRFLPTPVMPMSREEMDVLGWDACDIILVTGDAYVDHPSFGMAVIGRLLEAQGFRVGIISQPDWTSAEDFRRLGRPNLFFGVTAGNMDSMVNRYTADRKIRSDDAYSPNGKGGARPDRSVVVYSQRCREAYKDVPIVLGGIEASLRRIAHYDYWSDKVRRSVLVDAKADMLLFGNAERAIVELAHGLASGKTLQEMREIRGTAFMLKQTPTDWVELDSSELDEPGALTTHPDPYAMTTGCEQKRVVHNIREVPRDRRDHVVVRLPAYEQVKDDPVMYAHASRVFHMETNPGNARPLVQAHGNREVWLNPPPIPLTTKELDRVFELPYTRVPHPAYGNARIPAYEMIRFSVNIMRGCFGGCTFCSITEHEGRIIQSRSEDSIIREVEAIRDLTPGFTGNISDLGGPTANMWRLHCKDEKIESACRRLSCVFPDICKNLNTDQTPLIHLYRRTRSLDGIKRVFIASGLRYDLAVRTPEYVRELVTHHVGGYLKIAPEHTETGPLNHMMKPGMGTYDRFKQMFEKFSKEAGKEQYLIPYFIAAHPGTRDEDMLNLALWLKRNNFRLDQVQTFLPSPMAIASAMYHSGKNPLRKVHRQGGDVDSPKGERQRRLHKAFLRYHDAKNWPLLREALKRMGREDLIGNGKRHLVPSWQPKASGVTKTGQRTQRKGEQVGRPHGSPSPHGRKKPGKSRGR
jgi:uncharacterized radical SAM protein YgiQ